MSEKNKWINIIAKMYPNLHTSKRVMHTAKESDKKLKRIEKYLNRLEKAHQKASKSKAAIALLKKFYYKLYIINKKNIQESYFKNQQKIMQERGYGKIKLTKEQKQALTAKIIEDQQASLEPWIEYFTLDEEGKTYEIWKKYWVFQGMQKLGKYDKETNKFTKRDKTTTYPFPPLQKQAIKMTINIMEKYLNTNQAEEEIKSALGEGNFKTIYEYSLKQIELKNQKQTIQGKWVKYNQNSDYKILRKDLQSSYTGWCTANGKNFAKTQLKNGDFYVYYTLDQNHQPKIPRIAIRMEGNQTIGEIRGIAKNQNLEPEMIPILDEKLKKFPDKNKYYKKKHDMEKLTEISEKHQKGLKLTTEELKFIYEIRFKVEGFGNAKDPRIKEIISKRNTKKDYAQIFDVQESEIALNQLEWKQNPQKTKILISDLYLNDLTDSKQITLPEIIKGNLSLNGLTTTKNIKLPKIMSGNLYLNGLKSAKNLILPETMNGNLEISYLTNSEGLILPERINGYLNLRSLAEVKELILPKIVENDINLIKLKSAKGVILPQILNGSLYLNSLTSAKDLNLPETLNGSLYLNSLTDAKDLNLPETLNGNLCLSSLTSAKDLNLPETLNGSLYLNSLTDTKNLNLPETLNGSLYLNSLTDAKDLKLPETLNGNLYLNSLTSAKDLNLPETLNGSLNLNSLTDAKDLNLPETLNGNLCLNSLTTVKDLKLPETLNGDLELSNITELKDLKLPKTINGDLRLGILKATEKLILPQTIKGTIYLPNLTTSKGLTISKGFPLSKIHCPAKIKLELTKNIIISTITNPNHQTQEETNQKIHKKKANYFANH